MSSVDEPEIGHWDSELKRDGQVATVRLSPTGSASEPHWRLAEQLSELQLDNSIRVVVLRGNDDTSFLQPVVSTSGQRWPIRRSPQWMWKIATGTIRLHELLASLDKPVIAAVKGDAIGIGCSLLFAADLVVADRDAVVGDPHLGGRTHAGVVPGTAVRPLLPLFLSPQLAKELLMLARTFTAAELEQRGIINYALPANEVDAKVDEIVTDLLSRPAYALAWTKRVANRHVVAQLNRTLDSGIAYEMVNMLQSVAEEGEQFALE